MDTMKQLSVCMIVKDEQDLLPRCLDSLQGIADEIIIVDTGSQDETKAIAKRYTDKIYDYQWNQDFAAARNESLRHATGKWILVLDADEYLAKDDSKEWIRFVNEEEVVSHIAYTLPIINFTGEKEHEDEITTSPVTRLFPNFKHIHFERPIHEQLTRGAQGELYHKKIDLNIYHTGYQASIILKKDKHERNMLIFDQMKQNGNLNVYDWYTLGNQYRYAKEEEQAIDCYARALKGTNEKAAWYPHCLLGLISLYYKQDKLHHSWKLTEELLVRYKEYSEYFFIKGVHLETLGFLKEAVESYKKAIEVGEKRAKKGQEFWLVEPGYAFESPALQLVSLSYRMKDNQQAVYWLSRLLNKNKKNPRVLLQLLEWLGQNENEEAIIELLNGIYDLSAVENQIFLFKISLALGYQGLITYYGRNITNFKEFSKAERIRLAVIRENRAEWQKEVKLRKEAQNEDVENEWLQLALGALLWKEASVLKNHNESINSAEIRAVNDLIIRILEKGTFIAQAQIENHADRLFQLAKHLFLMRKLEAFDSFVQAVQSPNLINRLANYFYELNLLEMAINYYSILLSKDQLNGESLENLGQYHSNEKLQEEAVEFLNLAIQAEPRKRHLYVPLICQAAPAQKQVYMSQFRNHFPEFTSISFIANFFENQANSL